MVIPDTSSPFYAVVPARMASSRLPKKVLADIDGVPMVVRVARRAQRSGAARVLVATDHADIVRVCEAHHVEACLTGDHPSGTDRVAEVARLMNWQPDDVIVNVQGDEPLIDPALIAAVAACVSESAPMATAAHPVTTVEEFFSPNIVKVVLDNRFRALYFSRAPIPWHRDGFAVTRETLPAGFEPLRHIGIYAYQNRLLQQFAQFMPSASEKTEALEQLRVLSHGIAIQVHVTPGMPSPGVDTQADLEQVRQLVARDAGL